MTLKRKCNLALKSGLEPKFGFQHYLRTTVSFNFKALFMLLKPGSPGP